MRSLELSRQVPFERGLYALGIRFVGETVAKKLAVAFQTIDALASADQEALMKVDEIGPKIAESVTAWFASPSNRQLVDALRKAGLQLSLAANEPPQSDVLKGKTVVISGTFSRHSRDEYKAIIEANGGVCASSVTGKTSFILAGENVGPSKREKAAQLGIPMLDEETFLKQVELASKENG
jgi:DNA ligase (NAD+)